MSGSTLTAEKQIVKSGGPGDSHTGLRDFVLHRPARAFALLTLLYVLVCACVSHYKLLWLDELITLHVARLGSMRQIWSALAAGADPNPPVTHMLVHASRQLFGEHAFALRLPALCGYWLGMLTLFGYLLRRVPADWALAGTVLSMTMAGFDFSFESRSYALMYGFAMAAYFCWTIAADRATSRAVRRAALVGMSLAFMAGVSTNYFAVLVFLPICAGEVVRFAKPSRQAGFTVPNGGQPQSFARLDLPLWSAIFIGLTPLLVFRAQIDHSIAQFAPHAWNKVSLGQVADSYTQMVEIILYPLLALFLFYGVCRTRKRGEDSLAGLGQRLRSQAAVLPLHETVGIACLMLYPVLGYLVASVRGGMLSPRFVVPVCLGFAIAGTVAAYRIAGHVRQAGVFLLCFLLAWFVAREGYVGYAYAQQQRSFYNVVDSFRVAETYLPGKRPLVVADPLMVLTLQHYAATNVSSRIVFPVDFPAIWKYRGDDSPEQNIWAGKNTLYSVPVVTVAELQRVGDRYLVLATDGNWFVRDLLNHHYPAERLPIDTHADDIKGFTPLMHGRPVFYIGAGALSPVRVQAKDGRPIPFHVNDNLPTGPEIE